MQRQSARLLEESFKDPSRLICENSLEDSFGSSSSLFSSSARSATKDPMGDAPLLDPSCFSRAHHAQLHRRTLSGSQGDVDTHKRAP